MQSPMSFQNGQGAKRMTDPGYARIAGRRMKAIFTPANIAEQTELNES